MLDNVEMLLPRNTMKKMNIKDVVSNPKHKAVRNKEKNIDASCQINVSIY